MTGADNEQLVLSTWTDELNAALHPLGILLSGVDAASALGPFKGAMLEVFRAVTEDDILRFTAEANRYCETDKITPRHIRDAIERTKQHWQDQ